MYQDNRQKLVMCSINRKHGQLNQLEAFRKFTRLGKRKFTKKINNGFYRND